MRRQGEFRAFPADERIALDALTRQEGTKLCGTAYLMTGSWPLADELLQHVLAHLVHTGVDLTDRRSALTVARRRLGDAVRIRLAEVLQEAAQDQPTAPPPDGEVVLRQVEHARRDRLPWLVLGWLRPWAQTSPGPTPGARVQGSDPASSPPSRGIAVRGLDSSPGFGGGGHPAHRPT